MRLLYRCDGYPSKIALRRGSSATTGRNLARLHEVGFPGLAVYVRCARQDWSDPAPPGGGVPVLGRTGFWWRTLRPCLLLSWHLQHLVLGTGRPSSQCCMSVGLRFCRGKRWAHGALATSGVAKDGPCVEWRSLMCHTVTGPDRGDLVIVLPDDEASFADAYAYRAQGEQLFSY